MWDSEIRSCSWGTAAMVACWAATVVMLAVGWAIGSWRLDVAGLALSALGAGLMVCRDNAKTRRVVRAVMRETSPLPPVRPVRGE